MSLNLNKKKSSTPVNTSGVNVSSPTNSTAISSSAASNQNGSYGNKAGTKMAAGIKTYQEVVSFKPIKEHQYVTGPPSTHLYTRGAVTDYTEMTYKLLK